MAWATVSILASTLGIFYVFYLRIDTDRLTSLAHWTAEFEKAALELTRNCETPTPVLQVLWSINEAIGRRKAAYSLFQELHSYNVHKFEPDTDEVPEELRNCNIEMKKMLHGPLKKALKSGIIAMTYSSIFHGMRARALLAELELVDDIGALILTHTSERATREKRGASWSGWIARWIGALRPPGFAHQHPR